VLFIKSIIHLSTQTIMHARLTTHSHRTDKHDWMVKRAC